MGKQYSKNNKVISPKWGKKISGNFRIGDLILTNDGLWIITGNTEYGKIAYQIGVLNTIIVLPWCEDLIKVITESKFLTFPYGYHKIILKCDLRLSWYEYMEWLRDGWIKSEIKVAWLNLCQKNAFKLEKILSSAESTEHQ